MPGTSPGMTASMDCFVASAPRNDEAKFRFKYQTARGCAAAFSRRGAPEVCVDRHPPKNKRAQGKPDARCTRGLVCKVAQRKTHTSIQVKRRQSGLPCAMVLTAYTALSPVTGLSCHRRPRSLART